jgi:hypothetical protein
VDPLIDRIVGFLRGIGLPVREGEVDDSAFLPGLLIEAGVLVFDRRRLAWPGDLLHEAGHIAVTPPAQRALLPDPLAELSELAQGGEAEATAWAWAASVALGLEPAVLFHAGGYHGRSASLITTFSLGVYPGSQGLVRAGMTAFEPQARALGVPPYPHMIRWLRA